MLRRRVRVSRALLLDRAVVAARRWREERDVEIIVIGRRGGGGGGGERTVRTSNHQRVHTRDVGTTRWYSIHIALFRAASLR